MTYVFFDASLTLYTEQVMEVYRVVRLVCVAMGAVAVSFGAYKIIVGGDDGMKKGITIAISAVAAVVAICLLPYFIKVGKDFGQNKKWMWDPYNPETLGANRDLDSEESFNADDADQLYIEYYSITKPTDEQFENDDLLEAGDYHTGSYYKEAFLAYFDEWGVILDKEINWDNLTVTRTQSGYYNAEWKGNGASSATYGSENGKEPMQSIARFLMHKIIEEEKAAHYYEFKDDLTGTITQIKKQYADQHDGARITFHYDITNLVQYDGISKFIFCYGFEAKYLGWVDDATAYAAESNCDATYLGQRIPLSDVDKVIAAIDFFADDDVYDVYTIRGGTSGTI